MSQLIVLPKKAEAVKPKLRRSEIVKVLAVRIHAKALKEYNALSEAIDKKKDAVHAEILKLARKGCKGTLAVGSRNRSEGRAPDWRWVYLDTFSSFNVNIDISHVVTPVLQAKLARLDDERKALEKRLSWVLNTWRDGHLKYAKELALEKLGDPGRLEDRSAVLLADPGMVKAFDAMLAKLDSAESDQKAIAV